MQRATKKKLTQLLPEHEARMGEWADRWTRVGLSTEPADWEKFDRAVLDIYRFAGLKKPKAIVHVPSPMVLAFAAPTAAYLIPLQRQVRGSVDSAVESAVGSAVDSAVFSAVESAVGSGVRSAVESAVDLAVDSAVRSAVRSAVGSAVFSAVESAVRSAVRSAVDSTVESAPTRSAPSAADGALRAIRGSYYRYWGGQFWAGWSAFSSFFREVAAVELGGDLWERDAALAATVESAGWWWPHPDFVMVSDRPSAISLDETGRLHGESAKAIEWRDGFGIYFWHGVKVDADVIEQPASIDAKRILGEANLEVRRAMLERVGYEPLLSVAKSLSKDEFGELLMIDQADDEPIVLVKVVNSTAEPDGSFKDYVLRVPPSSTSPREAIAWTFGVPADAYMPVIET